jgi:antitoxin MazE
VKTLEQVGTAHCVDRHRARPTGRRSTFMGGQLTKGPAGRIYIVEQALRHTDRDMKVAFQKWGNSLALRVPKAVAQEIGASDGKAAEMSVRDGKLVIEVTKPKRRKRRFTLDELVAGITPENRHEEVDWGPPVGNEVW